MKHLTERLSSLFGRIRNLVHTLIVILAGATLAGAQVDIINSTSITIAPNPNDPNTWPATFNGAPDMGPYAWVDGPTHLQKDSQLANGVFVGQEGANRLFVCRVKMSDGVHPGKFFNGMCNVGWGGVEKVHTSGYELLVNTQPQNAKFFPQSWVSPATSPATTFYGGAVGNTKLRVCRAAYINGWHPGKEWEGKCNIGYGGKEVAEGVYQALSLGFDKAAWQAAQGTTQVIVTGMPTGTPTPTLDPSLFQTQGSQVVVGKVGKVLKNMITIQLKAESEKTKFLALLELGTSALTPETVRSRAKELMTIETPRFGPTGVNQNPQAWFVREDIMVKDLFGNVTPSGWFRLKFLDTNLCMDSPSHIEGSRIHLTT